MSIIGELARMSALQGRLVVQSENLSVVRSDNNKESAILYIGADDGLAPIKIDCNFNLWLDCVRPSRRLYNVRI